MKDVGTMMWDDRYDMHDRAGAGWLMALLMLILVVAVVVAVVALMRGTLSPAAHPVTPVAGRTLEPRAILQERFARGDIDETDYRARIRALDETGT